MGWQGTTTEIELGMFFRKMYCHKCGTQLKREKITKIFKKGEPGFTRKYMYSIRSYYAIGMDRLKRSHYIYKCPNCDLRISYDAQCIVAKKQKQLNAKILSEDDIF